MAYQGLDNGTGYTAEAALLADENGRDIMLVLVKATYDIGVDGTIILADEQDEICFEGEYIGDPGESSLKIAPEANFAKLATDIALFGHAIAPNGKAVTELDVGLKIGDKQQHVKVFGDRVWQKRKMATIVSWIMTKPKAFTEMPLVYEKAFGGKDLTPADENHYVFEARNLIGTGVIAKNSTHDEVALPNLEDPKNLIKSVGDRPQPMGFGFIAPDWQPRLAYSGTYDSVWEKTRLPMLPKDFKREFFTSAHPSLVPNGFLEGNESVLVVNASPNPGLKFNLPGNKPEIDFQFEYEQKKPLEVVLDTVLINTDDMKLTMLWRATQNVFNRVYEMKKITVRDVIKNVVIPEDYEITV